MKRFQHCLICRFLLTALLFLSTHPLFAAAGFEAINFQPATDNGLYLAVEGSQTVQRRRWTLGLTFDYASEPVIRVNAANVKIQDVIARELVAHVTGAYRLLPWLQIGLRVNTVPYMQFQAIDSAIKTTQMRMGDTLVNFKVRLLDNERYPAGIALVPFVTVPTGSSSSFTGNGVVTGGGTLVLETPRAEDRFSVALEVGARMRQSVQLTAGTRAANQLLYGFGFNLAVHPKVDLVWELRGFTLLEDLFGSQQRPIEFDGAAKVYPIGHWAVTVGGGLGVLQGIGNPTYRMIAGLSWIPEHKGFKRKTKKAARLDSDGDGIPDADDRCPTEPGSRENSGCPTYMKAVISPEEQRILTQMIRFDFQTSKLGHDAGPILDAVAGILKARPMIELLSIEGHCDFIGSVPFNNWLSKERAEMVKKALVARGVEPARLETKGWGKSRPLNLERNPKARAENRRVEFVIVEKEKGLEGSPTPKTPPLSLRPILPQPGEAPRRVGEF